MNNQPISDEEFEKELLKRDRQNMFYIKLIVIGGGSSFLVGVLLFILVMLVQK